MRVALVGLGNAAQTLHLPALAGIPSARVVGGFDLDPGRRAKSTARWGHPVFDSFTAMLAATAPEVVIVGTPPDSHADYCLRALDAGAHVICEKPFVSSVEEARRVIAAAQAAGLGLAINQEFREMPIFRALLEQMGAPGVGKLVFAQAWQTMDLAPWDEPGWRGNLTHRTLYEAGVHIVDFVLALFGEKPVSVMAMTSSGGLRKEEADAIHTVTLEFSGGRLAQVTQNRLCRGETQYFEVRADGTEASVRASFGGRARVTAGLYRSTRPTVRWEFGISGLAWREVGNRRQVIARNPRDPGMVATRSLFERTLAAFREGRDPPVSGRHGLDVVEVIAAAYRSAHTGGRIPLDGSVAEVGALKLG